MAEDVDGIFSARITAAVLEKQESELDSYENGALFIAYPRPPRVGSRVSVDLAFGEDAPTRYEAQVVWSRPARPGVVAGFRAQLAPPPPDVLESLRELVEIVRGRLLARQVNRPRAAEQAARRVDNVAIRERISAAPSYGQGTAPLDFDQRPKSFLLAPREMTVSAPAPVRPPPDRPPETGRARAIDLPELDDLPAPGASASAPDLLDVALDRAMAEATGKHRAPAPDPSDFSDVAAEQKRPPPPVPVPSRNAEPTGRHRPAPADPSDFSDVAAELKRPAPAPAPRAPAPAADPSDFSDLAEEFSRPAPPSAPPPRPAPAPAPAPPRAVRVAFASGRSYLVHFERFLRNGELYITHVPPLPPRTPFDVLIDMPDGDAPISAKAISDRIVAPPDVPRPGWVAKLIDPSGEIAERFAEASFSVTTPGA